MPNVVLIVADDMGWTDWGMNGEPEGSSYYETPRIDLLASEGVSFRNAYAASGVCSPSRHALLTGRSPARSRFTQWVPGSTHAGLLAEPPWRDGILVHEVTIADALRGAGYRTAFVGKWHLGPRFSNAMDPLLHGFQSSVGGAFQGTPPRWFADHEGSFGLPGLGAGSAAPGSYLTDALSAAAVAFVETATEQGSPFFLLLCHYAVHVPIEAPAALVEHFEAKPVSARHDDATYAAMLASLDASVGQVLDALEAAGVRDDTIVVFTSDNGGWLGATSNAPLRAGKGVFYEGGVRVPLVASWMGNPEIARGLVSDSLATGQDVMVTLLDLLELPVPSATDGQSFRAALEAGEAPREKVHFHYPHVSPQSTTSFGGRYVSALRAGDWKLLYHFDLGLWELFDLASDPGEQVDLARVRTDVAAELGEELRLWLLQSSARLPLSLGTGKPVPLPVPLPEPGGGAGVVLLVLVWLGREPWRGCASVSQRRSRTRPSWATDATRVPSRAYIAPWIRPRAAWATGLSDA